MTVRGIVAAGNWIVDHIKQIDRWPSEGTLCNIGSVELSAGGGPCNVLFDLAVCDPSLPLYAAGMLGKDENGDWFMSEIAKRGIDTRYMLRHDHESTSFTDVMSIEGRRTFFHFRGANAHLSFEHLAEINVEARIFYLGYLLLLDRLDEPDPKYGTVAARLLCQMRNKGYKTVVDLVSEAADKFKVVVLAALPYIDVLVLNEIEAQNCFDVVIRHEDGSLNRNALAETAKRLIDAGVQNVVVIHYPEGAVAASREGSFFWQDSFWIPPTEIVGSVGAGDAFSAGILYGLHEDLTWPEMLKIGVASAAFNLKSASATGGAVSIQQIRAKIQEVEQVE